MTGSGRGFDPEELRGGEGSEPSDGELGQAWAMGRELDALRSADRAHGVGGAVPGMPGAGGADPAFVNRVMAAIQHEPSPRPVAAGARSARQLRLTGVLASFRDAWRVAFGSGRGLAVRAGALAYLLIAVVALGSVTGIAVVGTAALLAPNATETPQASAPAVAPNSTPVGPPRTEGPVQPSEPGPSVEPGASAEPQESEQPGETDDPDQTPAPGDATGPTATRTPSGSPTETPESTRTPRPSTSPSASPSGSPKPTSTSGDH